MPHPRPAAERLIDAHAAGTPDALAFLGASGEMSRAALQRRIDAAARTLASRVEPGGRVAICTSDPGHELIAALAALAAGGVFVPLDADDPRLGAQLAASGARAVVIAAAHARLASGAEVLPIDDDGWVLAGGDGPSRAHTRAVDVGSHPDAPACVLYRPGCDTRPLGIVMPRRAFEPPVFGDELDVTPDDRVALPVGFAPETTCTAAIQALAAGAAVIDLGARTPLSPRAAGARLREGRATVLVAPAPLVERLARQFPWALDTVRLILCPAGLRAPDPLLSLDAGLRQRCRTIYGAPETGGYAAICRHDASGGATIRTPAGTRVLLLDRDLAPVCEGEGQVCVASERLALAYDGAPERTARAFVTCAAEGAADRIHLSGDLARRGADGTLWASGRNDRRTIVLDLRIEPGEIEAALRRSPRVADVRVETGAEGLAATVTPAPGERMDAGELAALLRASLPERLVPRSIAVMSQEPHSEIEQVIAGIWGDVLQKPHVGLDDNFFDLGGHSMKLVRVASLMQQRLGRRVSMMTLFAHPTIHKLARHLAGEPAAGSGAVAPS